MSAATRFDYEGQCLSCGLYTQETNKLNQCRDCAQVEETTRPPDVPESVQAWPGMFLALHGGSTPVSEYREDFDEEREWVMDLVADRAKRLRPEIAQRLTSAERDHWEDTLSTGQDSAWIQTGIVAVARLKAVVRDSQSPWAAQGQFHWVLDGVVRLPQAIRPGPGMKKDLWKLDVNTLAEVRRAYANARKQAG